MQLENVCVQPLIASRTTKMISIILVFVAFSLPLSTSITNVLLSFFLLLWIIEGKFNEKIIYIWENKACFASIILLASLVIGSLYSIASWHDILFYLKKMSKLIYLPFLIYYFKDPKQRTWTINAFIVAGMLTVITGITYCVTNQYNEVNPFKNTIDTSLVTTITTFLLMHKICINNKLYLKSILILCILTNVFYLFYISLGRTSQLIFLCLIAVFFIQKIKSRNKLLSLIMIIILTITLGYCGLISNRLHKNWLNVIHYYNNYKLNSFNYEQNSISQRLDYYKNTLLLIKEKPLFGWGTGSFCKAYKDFVIKNNLLNLNSNQQEYLYTTNPHNEYLLFGSQLGIFGIGLLLWFFYVLFKASFIIISYERYILQGIVVTMLIGCLANSWLMDFTAGHLFIILTAISLGALPHAQFERNNRTV